jgi:hypothetical protein
MPSQAPDPGEAGPSVSSLPDRCLCGNPACTAPPRRPQPPPTNEAGAEARSTNQRLDDDVGPGIAAYLAARGRLLTTEVPWRPPPDGSGTAGPVPPQGTASAIEARARSRVKLEQQARPDRDR